jgi:hypothetical protein
MRDTIVSACLNTLASHCCVLPSRSLRRRSVCFLFSAGFLLVLSSDILRADDPTAALIEAPRVEKYLYIFPDDNLSAKLKYALDNREDGVPLESPLLFGTHQSVWLVFRDFNPLKYQVNLSTKDTADPNYVQLQNFLDALTKLQGALGLSVTALKDVPGADAKAKQDHMTKRAVAHLEAVKESSPGISDPCVNFQKDVLDALKAVLADETKMTPATFNEWQDEADGLDGVKAVRRGVGEQIDKLKLEMAAVNEKLQKVTAPAEAVMTKSDVNAALCTSVDVVTLSALAILVDRAAHLRTAREEVLTGLGNLAATLDKFINTTSWMNENRDLQLAQYTLSGSTQKDVTITFARLPAPGIKNAASQPTSVAKKGDYSLTLRRWFLLVPEVGAAAVYSGLTAPKYGTAASGASTVVQSAGSDRVNLSAAVLLNLVFATRLLVGYPLLQMGVAANATAPAVLVGAGFRLSKPSRVAFSGGLAIGLVKDLTNLRPGDTVAGTAQIEADLTRQVTTSYYVALQYQF